MEKLPGRTRTYDKAVNSRLLYQLSYRGMMKTNRRLERVERLRFVILDIELLIQLRYREYLVNFGSDASQL